MSTTDSAAAALPVVSTPTEARSKPKRVIRPLGEQLIIRTLPPDSVGSIVIPDSAKRATLVDHEKPKDSLHFVEAEVIAVGPGKRLKGDRMLISDMAYILEQWQQCATDHEYRDLSRRSAALLLRAENRNTRAPLLVKPGDRILYHPSVQKFDRKVDLGDGFEYFIIREDSVLAVINKEDKGLKTGHPEGFETDRSAAD